MSFTIEQAEVAVGTPVSKSHSQLEADLPIREFSGYDKKLAAERKAALDPENKEESEDPATDLKQETKVEGEIATEAQEESVTLSPKISALARKEQAQRQRELALKRREHELADKLAKADKYEKLTAKLEAKDFSAAEELGMSYDEYTKYLVDKQQSQDPREEKVRRLEQQLEELKRQQEERTADEWKSNQESWKSAISELVTKDESYSSIKELKAEAAVLQHINDSFEEDGVELTADQACKEIEEALLQRAERLASLPKIKGKTLPPPKPETKPSSKTITQTITTTPKAQSRKPLYLMSESERYAEAIRRFEEEKLARIQGR